MKKLLSKFRKLPLRFDVFILFSLNRILILLLYLSEERKKKEDWKQLNVLTLIQKKTNTEISFWIHFLKDEKLSFCSYFVKFNECFSMLKTTLTTDSK